MTSFNRDGHAGTGPGEFTPDGCSVDLYARLPGNGEAEIVAAALPPGATLLELGAGAGRMTRPLVAAGLQVTAVDESEGMLAHVRPVAPAVRAPIEDLDLGRRFDAVLLASFLVNTADDAHRARLLRTCVRHTSPGGHVLIQRERDGLHDSLEPGSSWSRGELTVTVVSLEPAGDGASRTCLAYDFGGARWTQTFYSRNLPRPRFEAALAEAGLAVDSYLTDDRTWVRARVERDPASPTPASSPAS
ncbi:class I SAM-dependent methyltransferase [Streptomyces marispadix]|uniref:Class I SAM-dependent methyltransferase n=1 Tax=Streptomyces marispadix TaxID=2922868 RepID=A0ABS9T608_9ACTN|nr:class I SAM-dependent methyltransferase [Streptomyces marispadix]MCH6163930.1 class I SAM-dependent methyltransferase [Streptomyces marispadix]